ncbi:MAG: PPC domain-containing protein [Chloroflexota bacterium]
MRMFARCILSSLFFLLVFCLTPAITTHAAPIDETEPNNTAETAQHISTLGTENPIRANFGDTEDEDWFQFEAVQGETYVVELFNVAGATNSRGYSPGLTLYDFNFTKLKEAVNHNSNGAGNTNQGIQFGATSSGTHYVKVTHYRSSRGSGPYNLRIVPDSNDALTVWDTNHEPNNYSGIAFPLNVGRTAAISTSVETRNSSYITNNHDRDWFRFEAAKDQSYVVETFNVAKAVHPNGYAMQLKIYDSDFTVVAEDTDHRSNGGGNTNSSINFQATKGGTYYILVNPYNSRAGSGPYNIRILPQSDQPEASWDVQHEPNNWAVHAFELSIGRTHAISTSIETFNSSYITENPDRDWFRFEAEEGIAYAIETFNAAGAIHLDKYSMQVEVYDANFTQVAKQTDHRPTGGGTTNAGASFVATQEGTHYVKVYPYLNSRTRSA